jgi:hypothetical protein
MTLIQTGEYEYSFDNATPGVTYQIAIQVLWNGVTYQLPPFTQTCPSSGIVTADEVAAELGIASPTSIQQAVIANAIIKTTGAIRQYLGYDPILQQHTEYHPQQPFQSQISRGIWEVLENRAVLRQVAESATNEMQVQHLPVRECLPVSNPQYLYDSTGLQLVIQATNVNGQSWWQDSTGAATIQYTGTTWQYSNSRAGISGISSSSGPTGSYFQNQVNTVVVTNMALLVDYDGRGGSRPQTFPLDSNRQFGYGYWPNWDSFDANGLKVCADGIMRALGLWPTTPNTIQITYVAGYTYAEFHGNGGSLDASPIWDACLTDSVRRARRVFVEFTGVLGTPVGALASEHLGDYSYSNSPLALKQLYSGALSPQAVRSLSTFTNWGAFLGM